jgi:hypothetical protein
MVKCPARRVKLLDNKEEKALAQEDVVAINKKLEVAIGLIFILSRKEEIKFCMHVIYICLTKPSERVCLKWL